MKPLTPKQIVQKYHGNPVYLPPMFNLDQVVFLMKAYHGQFEVVVKKETIPYSR